MAVFAFVAALAGSRLVTAGSLIAAAFTWAPAAGELMLFVLDALFGFYVCDGNPHGRARNDTTQIETHIQMYMMQKRNQCPNSLDALKAAGITSRLKNDPWGTSYRFTCNAAPREVVVCSAGSDRAWGSEDDICSEAYERSLGPDSR